MTEIVPPWSQALVKALGRDHLRALFLGDLHGMGGRGMGTKQVNKYICK